MKLGVNIDHIATLRQQRQEAQPDPLHAARIAQECGADSIVAHLREDRRHIQDADLQRLKKNLKIPLAMEMAGTDEMVRIACRVKPARVCFVPEKRQELTTEGGLDIQAQRKRLAPRIRKIQDHHIEVSLFIDPDLDQVYEAKVLGAQTIELHTGLYASTHGAARKRELVRLTKASELATQLGLRLHAGHGLNYENVEPVAQLPGMQELNIGFAIVVQAVYVGWGAAVREMKQRIHF